MLNKQDIERLARAYELAPDSTYDPRVQSMIAAERARIDAAFRQLPIQIQFVDHDPYRSFEEMRDQIATTGTMYVYKGGSDTPLWDPHTNWKARAVHDWDHLMKSCDFSIEGEAAAFRSSAQCTPGLAPLYMSEILLQAAVANARGTFAAQKLVLLDEQTARWAAHLRGLKGLNGPKRPSNAAALVWTTAGILRVDSPEAAMVHLRMMGLGFYQAAVIIDAANQLNVKIDAQATQSSAALRGVKKGAATTILSRLESANAPYGLIYLPPIIRDLPAKDAQQGLLQLAEHGVIELRPESRIGAPKCEKCPTAFGTPLTYARLL